MQNAWRFIMMRFFGERLKEAKGKYAGDFSRSGSPPTKKIAAAAAQPRDRATAGSQD